MKISCCESLRFHVKLNSCSFYIDMNTMPDMTDPRRVFGIFIGKDGVGKSTIFNNITNITNENDSSRRCSCTMPSIGVITHHNKHEMQIMDTPGSTSPGYGCLLHHGLTCEPLNCIFVLIEYHPRIGSTMVESFWETFSRLKYESLDMVVIIVTKLDHFEPSEKWRSIDHVKKDIRKIFENDVGVERIIFSHLGSKKGDLLDALFEQMKDLPPQRLEYSDEECIQYFGKICQQKISSAKTVDTFHNDTVLVNESSYLLNANMVDTMRRDASDTEDDTNSERRGGFWIMFSSILRMLCCIPIQDDKRYNTVTK